AWWDSGSGCTTGIRDRRTACNASDEWRRPFAGTDAAPSPATPNPLRRPAATRAHRRARRDGLVSPPRPTTGPAPRWDTQTPPSAGPTPATMRHRSTATHRDLRKEYRTPAARSTASRHARVTSESARDARLPFRSQATRETPPWHLPESPGSIRNRGRGGFWTNAPTGRFAGAVDKGSAEMLAATHNACL